MFSVEIVNEVFWRIVMKIIVLLVIVLMVKILIKVERKLWNFKSWFFYFGLIFVLVVLRLFLEGYELGILKIV